MKKKQKIYLRQTRKQHLSVLIMVLISAIMIAGTKSYVPIDYSQKNPVEVSRVIIPDESISEPENIPEEKEDIIVDNEEGDWRSPIVLNLAFQYKEGIDNGDPSNSTAGQVLKQMVEKDSNWIAEISGLTKAKPEEVAQKLGKERSAVLGLYDMANETHNPDDPNSWVIKSWSKTNILFQDGDGKGISAYSNAKEILSMANVYTYWNGIEDDFIFSQYAESLWLASHSYSYHISDVYYCDGCMDEPLQDAYQVEDTDEIGNVVIHSIQTDTDITLVDEDGIVDMLPETSLPEIALPAETEPVPEVENPIEETLEYSIEDIPADWESIEGPERDIWAMVVADLSDVTMEETTDTKNLATEYVSCPGHIDLNITARICGLEENNGLFVKDSIGNKKDNYDENWQGWDEYNQVYVRHLQQQDWNNKYGLSLSSSMYMNNPLSPSEIEAYMAMLPDDTSEKRKLVVKEALESVGTIPYYWGGKASVAGYNGNNFGSITSPDENGRTLRGLDCSGWVNWVYWTALGTPLTAEGTAGLSHSGIGINRSELQPGDLIVLTGPNSHAYMFLAWSTDDYMYLIHETGGMVNNVTISRYSVHWPYYRSIIND